MKNSPQRSKVTYCFTKRPTFDPDITLSSVVYDAITKQGSTSYGVVTVPRAEESNTRLSDVVFFLPSQQLSDTGKSAAQLFRIGSKLVYPTLGKPVSKSRDEELGLFL